MKQLAAIALFAYVMTGCVEFEEMTNTVPETEFAATSPQTRAGVTTFATLPDPYSLANMQAVYDTYNGNRTLQATDLYVRFRPQNGEQLDLLEDAYGLGLFEYPLDLDIPDGVEYVDPTIPEGEPIWYYTTVKPNFTPPAGIPYEVIRQCYIPADNEVISAPPKTRAGESDMVEVEWLALERLGYVAAPLTRSGGGGGQRPQGHVRVWDNIAEGWESVKGVRVKVNSHTKIDISAYTNAEGYYQTNKRFWQENVKYTVVFHNNPKDFWIWEGLGNRAKYNHGSHTKYGCDIDISENNGALWQWAAINNAAWEYYEMCRIEGIAMPPSDLKILFLPNIGASSASMIRRISASEAASYLTVTGLKGFFMAALVPIVLPIIEPIFDLLGLQPDLTIGTLDRDYSEIYNSVNHELSHASHFSVAGSSYWAGYIKYIAQNYLDGNENATYGYGTGSYAGICEVGEMWGHAMGDLEMSEKYNPEWINDSYNANFSGAGGIDALITDDWIRPHPIWALITRGVLTKREVFDSMTSDIDTVNKWRNKLIAMYPSKAVEITTAFETGDVPMPPAPVLTVKNKTSFAIFSVTDPPQGATFEWQFNGSDVPDRNGSALTVFSYGPRELIPIQLSLAAPNAIPLKTIVRVRCRMVQNRRRSNWSETVSATITVTSPPSGGGSGGGGAHAPVAPILSASSDIVNLGANVTFRVTNYTTGSGRSFEWKKDGVVTGSSTAVSQTYRLQAASMSVQCRVRQDGQWSAWSSTKLVKVPPTPFVLPFGDSPAEQDGPEGPASME